MKFTIALSTILFLILPWQIANAQPAPTVAEERSAAQTSAEVPPAMLDWQALPDLPDPLGVAGPFVGVHNEALIVAGGANFPQPVWETSKVWHDKTYVLTRTADGYEWTTAAPLPRPVGYGAAVSTPEGVVCMGGNDSESTFRDVFLLKWDSESKQLTHVEYPPLPQPCAHGQAVLIGSTIYLAGGQSGSGLDSAMNNFWALDLSQKEDPTAFEWKELEAWPGPSRSLNLTVAQHNGYHECVYVMSGRRQQGEDVEFLKDVWEYTPKTNSWRQRQDAPRSVMAGTAIGVGQSHIVILGGDDGELFLKADELKDDHPGFIRESLTYHTVTDTWSSGGPMPANHVTTIPVMWDGRIVIASGEVRPRVRTSGLWSISPKSPPGGFATFDYIVLFSYLAAMVGIGVYFTRRNKNTDDFFRGGKHIPWWAAGCSIFATMLSSLTFTGIPSKAFAQDWVYATGNMMIPVVAFLAVFVALPFYRRLDVTSAYEYLEKRFNRQVRIFGSLSFAVFHIFRMAVVMSLTALALAVATPLTPQQSVLLMGILSIIYCTMGGIEAVIWTDTLQTFVLLGGAIFALILLLNGVDGNLTETIAQAADAEKFRMANFHWDMTDAQLALWVIIIGGIGQNISSYTADQAVVQRYMTSPTQKLAARSIWTNAILTIPATFLFFSIGTALFAYYRSHPEKLDPTVTTDQIFPMFIAREMPIGVAGLIVAGIFSAAQSTVSTSMNSITTTVVTDFLRPWNLCRTERSYLTVARVLTAIVGVIGTCFALMFIDPEIRSLFDTFMKVIGLLMGVLGGLFLLGVGTTRANAFGALTGALIGTVTMLTVWQYTRVNGYLYTAIGIASCVIAGYLASLIGGKSEQDLTGLTIYTSSGSPESTTAAATTT
ncbi:sodium:solute symporter family transporter [Rubinisphaera margarita]|uniref:sodium:solute symporter family transporter n=1 Tax=Rubinisphaera margarita TaxID=2909586 RepID=UPI001EE92EB1|nr:sodium/solute symporter [Rubinisphaera margarita]MCG6154382.1 sodium/solute symporter [Rubinisphaera margarita]